MAIRERRSSFERSFWIMVLIVTAARIWLAGHLGLGDDEAYYWDWARFPSWSYYDHPGMTAWLIALSRSLFGDTALAVRFPALILNTAGWIVLYQLTSRLFDPLAAFIAGLLYFLIPIYGIGGMMMVPDIPMSFAWICSMAVVWKIVNTESPSQSNSTDEKRDWIVLGLLSALGSVSKYTMVLVPLSMFVLLLSDPRLRKKLATPWPWVAVVIWLVGLFPIVIWNSQHHWASMGFQVTGRLNAKSGISFSRWLGFWGAQLGVLTPPVFVLMVMSAIRGFKNWADIRWKLILCFSLPTLVLFELQALLGDFKPHWAAPGYLSLLMGAGFLCAEVLRHSSKAFSRRDSGQLPRKFPWSWKVLGVALALFLVPLNALVYADLAVPVIPKLYRALGLQQPWNPQWDPVNDLYGWPEAGARAKELQSRYSNTFLATHRYQLTSQLGFVTGERVWNLTPSKEGYDFIQTFDDLRALVGRDVIVVTDNRFEDSLHEDEHAFAHCEPLPTLDVERRHEVAKHFYYWRCQDIQRRWIDWLIAKKNPALEPGVDVKYTDIP